MTVTNKFVIPFLFCVLLVNTSALHSAEVFAQKPVLAAEPTTSVTPSASARPSRDGSAQISNLPTVHILPDNPLYFLKTIKERVQLLLTSNASNEANLLLSFSQKRLAEALKVAEKGKVHISEKLFEAFGKDIEAAQKKIKGVKERGQHTYGLLIELQKTIAYQKSVVEELQGEADFYSSEVGERVEALNSFLVKIDEDLSEATGSASGGPPAVPYGRMKERQGIFDWLRGLFGKKEILRPLAE